MTRRQLADRVANDMALARKEFARRLRSAREAADLTQVQVAEKVGVDWATYQRWESAKTTPRPNKMALIAGALSVDVAHLQGSEEDTDTALERLARITEDNARALREIRVVLDGLLEDRTSAIANATEQRQQMTEMLERIEASVTDQRELVRRTEAAGNRIAAAMDGVREGQAAPPRSS